MKIIVLVKQVPDPEAVITVSAKGGPTGNSDGQGLEIENKYVLNFFDQLSVEEAIRIKEKLGLSIVTVISLGPRRAVESLRTCLAMGADRVILVNDPALENSDAYTIAKLLAQFIKKELPDIILCGKESMDDNACQVGPAVAEFLGLPHVSTIIKLEIGNNKTALVERQIEGGKEIVTCSLPAVFTTQKGINEPRIPLVTGVMKAMRAKIEEINLATLGLNAADVEPKTRILKYYQPPKRPKVKIIEGELPDKIKTLIKLLREEAKVI